MKSTNQRNFTLTDFVAPQNFLEREGQSGRLLSLDHFDWDSYVILNEHCSGS